MHGKAPCEKLVPLAGRSIISVMRRTVLLLPTLCAFALLPGGLSAANAQSTATATGVQAAPPTVTPMPTMPEQLEGRRDIRGCPMGSDCSRARDRMREFELEAFSPKTASNPWIADGAAPAIATAQVAKVFKSRVISNLNWRGWTAW